MFRTTDKKIWLSALFCPKCHCEINIIEQCWAHMKQFLRQKTDQIYHTMIRPIEELRINCPEQQVHLKLFRRFWKCLAAYNQRKIYSEVI